MHYCFATATRPDIIKLAPVISRFRENDSVLPFVLHARQHTDLADQAFNIFDIYPDISSEAVPEHMLNLSDMLSFFISFYKTQFDIFLKQHSIDGMFVHGDVIGSLAAALTAFFYRIPVFHIEAGLRTSDFQYPFPEEGTRRLISRIATIHFAPTVTAKHNLLQENIASENIVVTGNTIVDSLNLVKQSIGYKNYSCPFDKKVVLLTLHRRELWQSDLFVNYLIRIGEFAETHPEYEVVFPVHPNPQIMNVVRELKQTNPVIKHIKIIHPPFSYEEFVYILENKCSFVITDSGGVLEEACVLGIPCLVLRQDTERPESLMMDNGFVKMIGKDLYALEFYMDAFSTWEKYQVREKNTLFGDGNASERIYNEIIKNGRGVYERN